MWVLIIYIYAGMMAKGDSVALVSVPGFTNAATCEQAGKQTEKFVAGSMKEQRYQCVKQ